jgi:hypothetical protein
LLADGDGGEELVGAPSTALAVIAASATWMATARLPLRAATVTLRGRALFEEATAGAAADTAGFWSASVTADRTAPTADSG